MISYVAATAIGQRFLGVLSALGRFEGLETASVKLEKLVAVATRRASCPGGAYSPSCSDACSITPKKTSRSTKAARRYKSQKR